LVLGHDAEKFRGLVLGQRLLELVDLRRDLQTLHENLALPLQTHISWPLYITSEVTAARADIATDAEATRPLWVQRICPSLGLLGYLLSRSLGVEKE
jgi:hypothetical protein